MYVRANAYKHLCIFMWRMWDILRQLVEKSSISGIFDSNSIVIMLNRVLIIQKYNLNVYR